MLCKFSGRERRRHGIGKFATLKDDTDRLPPSRKASLPAALAFPDFDHPRSKVARATAAKAKLLLHELKNVKADLAFVKERRAQLEEDNIHLRENHHGKGSNPAIRLQLESLLAEKARLAHESSVYQRENRIIKYHQLTMQDEGSDEVTHKSTLLYPL
uniref:Uncharacterized protein n=1 Tax=Brassica campestris TaxID=3711 RepID=M4CN69_BRACM|nr:unnamed protein product [Brassica rapa]